jgi:hypothetical protein
MRYAIPVTYSMVGTFNIEASSLQDAIRQADFLDLSEANPQYLDDSYEVDYQNLEELNPNLNQEDKEHVENNI